MATITKRTRADGSTSYKAEIVIKNKGVIVHRESKTFDRLRLASDWAKRREVEIQETGIYKSRDALSVGAVIQRYINEFSPDGRSKRFDLEKLMTRDIAKLNVHTLAAKDLIKHIRLRNTECQPQTAVNDLIWLGTVIKTMSGVIEIDTDPGISEAAREVLRREGLIAKSQERERRPTKAEIWALARYFGRDSYMLHLMYFAIYSARRQSEITRILAEDINHDNRTLLIRALKDPRKKGLVKRCKLPRSAYKIILKHGRKTGTLFPYNAKSVGNYFTRACKVCGIKNLHFHDLRHEATSRLFEQGLSIQQVQQVTLHSTWQTLQRYVNLDPGDVDI